MTTRREPHTCRTCGEMWWSIHRCPPLTVTTDLATYGPCPPTCDEAHAHCDCPQPCEAHEEPTP